jgi:hypothetical protein
MAHQAPPDRKSVVFVRHLCRHQCGVNWVPFVAGGLVYIWTSTTFSLCLAPFLDEGDGEDFPFMFVCRWCSQV